MGRAEPGRWDAPRSCSSSRAEQPSLSEAERTRRELQRGPRHRATGAGHQRHLPCAGHPGRRRRGHAASRRGLLAGMPAGLRSWRAPRCRCFPVRARRHGRVAGCSVSERRAQSNRLWLPAPAVSIPPLAQLVPSLEAGGRGVIMTMGKGGVGKTTVAGEYRRRACPPWTQGSPGDDGPRRACRRSARSGRRRDRVSRIDPVLRTRAYAPTKSRLRYGGRPAWTPPGARAARGGSPGPCTEEIAVFRAFAHASSMKANTASSSSTPRPPATPCSCSTPPSQYHREVRARPGGTRGECAVCYHACRTRRSRRSSSSRSPRPRPCTKRRPCSSTWSARRSAPSRGSSTRALVLLSVTDPVLVRRRANEGRFHAEVP